MSKHKAKTQPMNEVHVHTIGNTKVMCFECAMVEGEFDVIKVELVFQHGIAQSAIVDYVYDGQQCAWILDMSKFNTADLEPEYSVQSIDMDIIDEPVVCELVFSMDDSTIVIKVRDAQSNELIIPMVKTVDHAAFAQPDKTSFVAGEITKDLLQAIEQHCSDANCGKFIRIYDLDYVKARQGKLVYCEPPCKYVTDKGLFAVDSEGIVKQIGQIVK